MSVNIVNLKNQLNYDPLTGVLTWKFSGSGRRDDLIAGYVKKKGINIWRRVVFEQKEYTSSQLIWSLMTGEFPKFIIDHIDGNPINDKWNNLRRGDKCVDQRNARKSKANKTGVTGVRLNNGYYLVNIGIGTGKQKYIGCSKDFFEAVCMRKKAEIEYNYSPTHGR